MPLSAVSSFAISVGNVIDCRTSIMCKSIWQHWNDDGNKGGVMDTKILNVTDFVVKRKRDRANWHTRIFTKRIRSDRVERVFDTINEMTAFCTRTCWTRRAYTDFQSNRTRNTNLNLLMINQGLSMQKRDSSRESEWSNKVFKSIV